MFSFEEYGRRWWTHQMLSFIRNPVRCQNTGDGPEIGLGYYSSVLLACELANGTSAYFSANASSLIVT